MNDGPAFVDHFASVAADYARFRPGYPPALFDFLSGMSPDRDLAWDCGTGTGIAAIPLAGRFSAVVATDASEAQLAQAPLHPRVTWRALREGASGLPVCSASLVTVAQAAHWFDLDAFYHEVDRVLKPGGLVALWCYGILSIDAGIDRILHRFEHGRVGPYWPEERRHVDAEYRTLRFPYARIDTPAFAMEATLTRAALLGYLGSWSAVSRYRSSTGEDPLLELETELAPLWPGPEAKLVRWPLTVVAGRAGPVPHAREQSGILR
jgi:SAM-dependent methyltransferase